MTTIASIKEVQDFRGVRVYQVLNLSNKVIAERSFYEDAVAYVDLLLSAKSKIKMTVWGNWNGD